MRDAHVFFSISLMSLFPGCKVVTRARVHHHQKLTAFIANMIPFATAITAAAAAFFDHLLASAALPNCVSGSLELMKLGSGERINVWLYKYIHVYRESL